MQPVANSETVLYECRKCNAQVPDSEFYNRLKDRMCKECCRRIAKERYHTSAETRTSIKYRNRVKLVKSYGLTMDDFENMLVTQHGMCAGCNVHLDLFAPNKQGNAACIDHDHDTGKVRGLLCRCCNLALGYVKDCPTTLRGLALYLEKHNG